MNDACGSASRMCFALPKTYAPVLVSSRPFVPYWLRCASSAITTTFEREHNTGCAVSSFSSMNFWIVVKMMPPDCRAGQHLAELAPALRLLGRLLEEILRRAKLLVELPVEIVAIRHHHQRRVVHLRLLEELPGVAGTSRCSCPEPCVCQKTPALREPGTTSLPYVARSSATRAFHPSPRR